MIGMWLASPMVGNTEIGLVVLTIFSQMAAGVTAFLLISGILNKKQVVSTGTEALTRRVVSVALAAAVFALVISLTHLGQPTKAYRALFYHLSSWMGKETLFLGLFVALLLVYAIFLFRGSDQKTAFEMSAAVAGVLAVFSGSMIYAVLGSVPAWNSAFTVAFFLLSLLLLGGSLFLLLIALPIKSGADERNTEESRLKTAASILKIVLFASIVTTIAYIGYLGMGSAEAKKTLSSMTGNAIFWLRIVLGLLAPLIIIRMLFKAKGAVGTGGQTFSYLCAIFALVLAGELMGRLLFFKTAAMHLIGGNGSPY